MKNSVEKQEVMTPIRKETFFNKEFSIYGSPEKPLLLAKEVAAMIEHSDTSMMLKNIEQEEKLIQTILVSGQNRDMWFVTEHGLYEILFQSRKPIARQFKKQVKVILEKMRTGKAEQFKVPTKMSEALRLAADLADKNEALQLENSEIRNKVEYREVVTKQEGINIGDFSKTLYAKCEINMGRNTLFDLLREMKVLQSGNNRNKPYQKYIDQGYFTLSEKRLENGRDVFTPFLTPKGQTWLYKKLKIEMESIQKVIDKYK